MVTIVSGSTAQLPTGVESALASYRHKVFIEALQWPLPDMDGFERDQFDRDDTLYVVARELDGEVCGCARLLPTTRAYLLAEVFPEMMNGAPVPRSHEVWELSRFATMPVGTPEPLPREETQARRRQLLGAVVQAALARGATRLILVTVAGVERLMRNLGVHAHRAGPPRAVDGKPTLALWLELDAETCRALGVPVASALVMRH
ncbi:MAG: GNAT family N-acetyltransferase [Rhodanobacteraceae bacterium]|nr:MAG: GNAT family N-acetyltransferase [Rhodanobacteraceae bacterium]